MQGSHRKCSESKVAHKPHPEILRYRHEFFKLKLWYGNSVALVKPNLSLVELLRHVDGVACANSSVIFDSLAHDMPVVSYSMSYFQRAPNVVRDFTILNRHKAFKHDGKRCGRDFLKALLSSYVVSDDVDSKTSRHQTIARICCYTL